MGLNTPLSVEELVRAGAVRRDLAQAHLQAEVRRREEVLRRAVVRYVSPQLAEKILEDVQLRETLLSADDLRAHAVVLFADLRGFTGLSERLEPRQVVPLLNEYFSLLTEITLRHDGTVFHMAGDCLMLGFGVPLEQPDSPGRAVRAAQEMLSSFAVLARSWQDRFAVEAGLGIGINEGDVVAGNIGSSSYMSYTLIGDTVNVAARLCQRARAGEMLFSRALKQSLDALGVDVGATLLPPMQLRGRSRVIDIFCVPAAKRAPVSTADTGGPGDLTPLAAGGVPAMAMAPNT